MEELQKRYAAFESRLATFESRLDTIEANTASLITGQASMEASIDTLMEAQRTLVATVSSLTERMDTFYYISGGLDQLPAPLSQLLSPSLTHFYRFSFKETLRSIIVFSYILYPGMPVV